MKSIKPGRGPSAMGALGSIICVVFGIFWTIMASSTLCRICLVKKETPSLLNPKILTITKKQTSVLIVGIK